MEFAYLGVDDLRLLAWGEAQPLKEMALFAYSEIAHPQGIFVR
jgi:hypothetical protein